MNETKTNRGRRPSGMVGMLAALLLPLTSVAIAGAMSEEEPRARRQDGNAWAQTWRTRPEVRIRTAPRVAVRVRGGYLGVGLVSITPELRAFYGAPDEAGVLVSRVEEESPAASAGLMVGDVITSVAGEETETARDVARLVSRREEGDEVEIGVVRSGASRTVTATLEARRGPRAAFFGEGGPRWVHLDSLQEDLPRLMEDFQGREWEEVMEDAAAMVEELDLTGLTDRLREAEERLRELERKLEEREREEGRQER